MKQFVIISLADDSSSWLSGFLCLFVSSFCQAFGLLDWPEPKAGNEYGYDKLMPDASMRYSGAS